MARPESTFDFGLEGKEGLSGIHIPPHTCPFQAVLQNCLVAALNCAASDKIAFFLVIRVVYVVNGFVKQKINQNYNLKIGHDS